MYAIYNTTYSVLSLHNTLSDALKEYEAAKQRVLENNPTGGEQIMLLELKKIAEIFVDAETKKIKFLDAEQNGGIV